MQIKYFVRHTDASRLIVTLYGLLLFDHSAAKGHNASLNFPKDRGQKESKPFGLSPLASRLLAG